ncbi:hypothetical protein QUA03_13435, partial [Microcoleus sp. S36b_A4]|uniref:hypothetical protein n=1 Tax=Microcoleus sp. S36b_A4 TaxID=3055420 RepID=UPI002FCEBD74
GVKRRSFLVVQGFVRFEHSPYWGNFSLNPIIFEKNGRFSPQLVGQQYYSNLALIYRRVLLDCLHTRSPEKLKIIN